MRLEDSTFQILVGISVTVAEIGYPRKMRLPDVLPEKMGLDLRVPARTIPMGRRSVTGRVIVKGKAIGCESNLEHDFLARLAMDPSVADVLEQPVTIPYVDINGRRSRYTPCVDAPCGSRRFCSAVVESTGAVMCPASYAARLAAGPDELRGAGA